MNATEFRDWFREHTAANPSLAAWIDNMPKDRATAVLSVWQKVLADSPLREAKDATLRIARGDDEPPKVFDETPKIIRRLANAARFAASFAAPVYRGNCLKPKCELCNDRGQVVIWHPVLCEHLYRNFSDGEPLEYPVVSQQEFWRNWLRAGKPKTCAILCRCDAGSKLAELRTPRDQDGRTSKRPAQLTEQNAIYDYDNLNDARQAGKPQAVSVYDF